jgi:uncharacterized membrane protein required for colicin V production
MELLPADYVVCAMALTASVLGLFRGFSGALAFFAGVAAGGAASFFCWTCSSGLIENGWMRGIATLVAFLLALGVVRVLVKKIVNGLLAQPTDAVFGALVGLAGVASAVAAWAASGMFLEYSVLASALADRL